MSDFIGDRQCVTHHYACDCREEKFKKLEAENKRLREALNQMDNNAFVIRLTCEQALKGD